MANFDTTTQAKISAAAEASRLLQITQSTYHQAKVAQAYLNRYTANSDPAFNAVVNAMFTSGERSELGAMLSQINTLVSDWEANHSSIVSGV